MLGKDDPTIPHAPKNWTADHIRALVSAYSEGKVQVKHGTWFRFWPHQNPPVLEVPATFSVLNRELFIVGIRHECMHSRLTTPYHSNQLAALMRHGKVTNALVQAAEDVRIDCAAEREFPKAEALHKYLYSKSPFAIPVDSPNTYHTLAMAVKLYGVIGAEAHRLSPRAQELTRELRKTLNTKAHCETLVKLHKELEKLAVSPQTAAEEMYGNPGGDGPGKQESEPGEPGEACTSSDSDAPSTEEQSTGAQEGEKEEEPGEDGAPGEDSSEDEVTRAAAEALREIEDALDELDDHFRKILERQTIENLTEADQPDAEEIMERAREGAPKEEGEPGPDQEGTSTPDSSTGPEGTAHAPETTDTSRTPETSRNLPPIVQFQRRPYAPDRLLDNEARDTIVRAFRRLAPFHVAGEHRLNPDVVQIAVGMAGSDIDLVLRSDVHTTGEDVLDYGRLTLIVDTSGSQGGETGRFPTAAQEAALGEEVVGQLNRYHVLSLLAGELFKAAVSQSIEFRVICFADQVHVLTTKDYQLAGTVNLEEISSRYTGQSTENFHKVQEILAGENYDRPELYVVMTDGCWHDPQIRRFASWRDAVNAQEGKHAIQIGFAYQEQLNSMRRHVNWLGLHGLYDRFIEHSQLEELAGYITAEIDRLF